MKISNALKRPKMRFLAPKGPIFLGGPGIIKNPPLVKNKISDEKNLEISNALKRPKMRFLAPKAPIFWGCPEIIKNSPLVDHRSATRGEFLIKIVLIPFPFVTLE